jgi:phenylacetate-coenzyme A ligase PaaK-like adenylate-forming protein
VENPALQTSPLYRFVYLKSFTDIASLAPQLEELRPYLQTAGLFATREEWVDLEYWLTSLGVTRLTEIGKMLSAQDGAPHDGTIPLSELIRWVDTETESRLPHNAHSLRGFLQYVYERSPFYHKFWQNMEWPSVHHFEDRDDKNFLRQIPLLSKHIFYRHTPPDSQEIFTTKYPHNPIIFSSGGSTGRPKYSYFTTEEFDRIAQALAEQYLISGLSAQDVVANLFVAGHLWSSFLVIDRAINKIGVTNLPIGGHLGVEEMIKYILAFKPTALFGLPSSLTALLNHCLEHEIQFSVAKIFYAGEHIAPSMVNNFMKHWGVMSIHSAGYASVDAGILAYQCNCQTGGLHHVFSDLILLELITPRGELIERPLQEGEIVATALYRKLMPIVRYRTGDLGKYVEKPCACGRKDIVFELTGRCDDRLQIGGSRISVQDIGKLLSEYEFLTGIYQFVAQYKNEAEFLQVFIEYRKGHKFPPHWEEEFKKKFYEVFAELSFTVSKRWISEPEIVFVPEETIPRMERTRKVKLIDDRRR